MKIEIEHRQSAHCESGTTSNLLRFHGIDLSEPMVFGLGSGLFFTYLPFIKPNDAPLISFRIYPGGIAKRLTRKLGIKLKFKTFRNPQKAMDELDRELYNGNVVGLVTGVFHLPYFPPEFRFHFNAHHILVFGKEGDSYLVSDPIMQQTETILASDLLKARFAQGALAPKGKMYTISYKPDNYNLNLAVVTAIRKTSREMLFSPLPLCGVCGMRYLAGQVRRWPVKLESEKARLYLGQIIRMSEEIGTGGAGFRFIYAAFLQEAAERLKQDQLKDASAKMTAVGDMWRDFAYLAAKKFKRNQSIEKGSFDTLAHRLLDIAKEEKNIFYQLKSINL